MGSLVERHAAKIVGVLSCFDRVIIQGTLPGLCYADGMTAYLRAHQIRIFDYPRFAEPYRHLIRRNAERVAEENGLEIEFVRKSSTRKEAIVERVLEERGRHPGLVHILSAMESCPSYRPWRDKKTGRSFLKPSSGKCLHYYFYFIDEEYGLCYLRVPTWCPFRLQFYFNGHGFLARQLEKKGIAYQKADNAFLAIDNLERAQHLADSLDARRLHRAVDRFAARYCPVTRRLGVTYHWSLMQVEYATDVLFERQSDLGSLYDGITRTAIHTVKPKNVATFLGRKLTGNYRDELGNDFSTRIEGTRIRHHMGPSSIKMYDKFGLILRIETTTNNVGFFKHHRWVEQRDGTRVFKLAPLKKSIYSLGDLRELMLAANRRYLEFISDIDDPTTPMKRLAKIAKPVKEKGRSYRGFNFFSDDDQTLFEAVAQGEHTISGMRNKDIRRHLPHLTASQMSRHLKRLRTHGLIKRIGRTYKYYLTKLGRQVVVTGLKLRSLVIMPELAIQS